MSERVGALVLAVACLVPACATDRRAGPRAPLPQAAAAVAVKVGRSLVDLAEVIVWRAPKLLLYELPAWLFYRGPSRLLLALSSKKNRVGVLIESLAEADEEGRLAADAALEELTGLPLGDAAEWRTWWKTAAERPESRWAPDFADSCLADLENDDFLVRQDADARLRALSGRDAGYDAKGTAKERRSGIETWRAWRAETFGPGGDDR